MLKGMRMAAIKNQDDCFVCLTPDLVILHSIMDDTLQMLIQKYIYIYIYILISSCAICNKVIIDSQEKHIH